MQGSQPIDNRVPPNEQKKTNLHTTSKKGMDKKWVESVPNYIQNLLPDVFEANKFWLTEVYII